MSQAQDNTIRFQQEIDAAAARGGGRVTIPPGTHLCGSLHLRDHIELHLTSGAHLRAAVDEPELFPGVGEHDESLTANSDFGALIQAHDCRHVSITGLGIIDGAGDPEHKPDWRTAQTMFRPAVAYFDRCEQLRIEGVRIINSRWWTLHIMRCNEVFIRGISMHNTWPNSDGIDPDGCRHVIISDCHLVCGDDAIVAKSTQGDDCEDICITNCILEAPEWACFKLGTESRGNFRNVTLNNCILRGHVAFGLYLKDGGVMEDIIASNLRIESHAAYPILIDAMRRDYQQPEAAGCIRRVRLSDCSITGPGRIWVEGEACAPLEAIDFRGIHWRVTEPLPQNRVGKPYGSARVKPDPQRPAYEDSNEQLIIMHAEVTVRDMHVSGSNAVERVMPFEK